MHTNAKPHKQLKQEYINGKHTHTHTCFPLLSDWQASIQWVFVCVWSRKLSPSGAQCSFRRINHANLIWTPINHPGLYVHSPTCALLDAFIMHMETCMFRCCVPSSQNVCADLLQMRVLCEASWWCTLCVFSHMKESSWVDGQNEWPAGVAVELKLNGGASRCVRVCEWMHR